MFYFLMLQVLHERGCLKHPHRITGFCVFCVFYVKHKPLSFCVKQKSPCENIEVRISFYWCLVKFLRSNGLKGQ